MRSSLIPGTLSYFPVKLFFRAPAGGAVFHRPQIEGTTERRGRQGQRSWERSDFTLDAPEHRGTPMRRWKTGPPPHRAV